MQGEWLLVPSNLLDCRESYCFLPSHLEGQSVPKPCEGYPAFKFSVTSCASLGTFHLFRHCFTRVWLILFVG